MARRPLSTRQRLAVFKDAGGICHICGGAIQVGQSWEVEHVIPLAQGGDDAPGNMKPAHVKCHKAKTADDAANTAKAKRREALHVGAKSPPAKPIHSRGFLSRQRTPKPRLPPKSIYRDLQS